MHDTHFLVREPLLDPQQRVIGYELSWRRPGAAPPSAAACDALLSFLAQQLGGGDAPWRLGDKRLFLEAVPAMLAAPSLAALPAAHLVLSLRARELGSASTTAALRAARACGLGIALRGTDPALLARPLAPLVSHVELAFTGTDVATQARAYAAARQSGVELIGRPVASWAERDACAALGLPAFVGKLHLTPRPEQPAASLSPAQRTLLQLMRMVQDNEEVPRLEAVLKRDPALAYKLLRLMNSAGLGGGRGVQSLRQAIQLLGYAPLYRWLTLLLAGTQVPAASPALMDTAVVRARLAELLGRQWLPPGQTEYLFVAGMFSLLDRLLGVPMEEVLGTLDLPEEITRALLARDGLYGPYLALAEACELSGDLVASLAATLGIDAATLNQAHLEALVWAQTLAV